MLWLMFSKYDKKMKDNAMKKEIFYIILKYQVPDKLLSDNTKSLIILNRSFLYVHIV